MRLIDADKMQQHVEMQISIIKAWAGDNEILNELVKLTEDTFYKEINLAPTVDAIPREWVQQYIDNIWAGVKEKYIPIEWIKKYAHKCIELQDTNYFSFRDLGEIGNGILAMLEEWEKENETN